MSENELTYYWNQFEQLYRSLAKQWHPDHQPSERREIANRRMQWLNTIYKETRDSYLQMAGG